MRKSAKIVKISVLDYALSVKIVKISVLDHALSVKIVKISDLDHALSLKIGDQFEKSKNGVGTGGHKF